MLASMVLAVVLSQAQVSNVPELPKDLAELGAQLDAQMHVAGYEHPMADPPKATPWVEGLPGGRGGTQLAIRVTMYQTDSPERQAELARLRATPDGWRCYVARGLYAAIGAWGRYLRTHGRDANYVQIALAPLYQQLRDRARACWDDHGQGPGASRGAMDAQQAWSGKRLEAFESLWGRGSATERVIAAYERCIPVPMPGITACAPTRDEVYQPTPGEGLLMAAAVVIGLMPEAGPIAWPVLAQRLAAVAQ